MTTASFDREALFQQVWAEAMTKVALRYGVSSSYLARVCERMNVPRPARGYWAQLEAGKAPPQPALPELRPGDELTWSRDGGNQHTPHALNAPRVRRALPKPPADDAASTRRPAARLPKEHPLLVGARRHFEGVRESDSGYLRPTKRRLVDLFVSEGSLDRALTVANKIFRALETHGHQVTFPPTDQHLGRPTVDERSKGGRDRDGYGSWGPDRPTVVYIGTVAIGLTIFELSDEIEVQYLDGKYVPLRQVPIERRHGLLARNAWITRRDMPSGKLCLRASSPYTVATWEKQWREARKGELTSLIPEIVAELEASAVTVAALVEEGEHRAEQQRREWQRQLEQWEREQAARRDAQHTKESREELSAIIAAWAGAKSVESFFEDVERRAEALSNDERAIIHDHLQRARALLGGVDALQRFGAWRAPDER